MDQENLIVEKDAKRAAGMPVMLLTILSMLAAIGLCIYGGMMAASGEWMALSITIIVVSSLWLCVGAPLVLAGLRVLKPNEALVLTFFGTYFGTLKGPGFFFVNPFVGAAGPSFQMPQTTTGGTSHNAGATAVNTATAIAASVLNKKISLKAMTLNNDKQKVNDALGNPIIIGIVVIWKVVNTAKAVFNVDNYTEYLSIQCDSALRNIVRLYPYDGNDDENEKSLRGSSQEISESLKKEIQEKVELAGLEIIEARITHLSYAPEIAVAMLQKQQASAVVAARQLIVEGAVGMVDMALAKLSEKKIVELDEERKAAMVSNLLVVLCGNKDAQPVVNSGSIY